MALFDNFNSATENFVEIRSYGDVSLAITTISLLGILTIA